MATNLPVKLIPVQLASGYCPASYQQFNEDIMKADAYVELGSVSTVITQPGPPDELVSSEAVWLRTDEAGAPVRFYKWSVSKSLWISPHPVAAGTEAVPAKELRVWIGSLTDLAKYEKDDRSTLALTDTSGPFWEYAGELTGRIPIGVNDASTEGPDLTLPQYALNGKNTGSEDDPLGTVRLTDFATLPQHSHGLGWAETAANTYGADLYVMPAESDTPLQDLFSIPSIPSASPTFNPLQREVGNNPKNPITDLNSFTFDAVLARNTAREVEKFDTRMPVIGIYWIRRTIRVYYAET